MVTVSTVVGTKLCCETDWLRNLPFTNAALFCQQKNGNNTKSDTTYICINQSFQGLVKCYYVLRYETSLASYDKCDSC